VKTPDAQAPSERAPHDQPRACGLGLTEFPLAALRRVRPGRNPLVFEAVSWEGEGPISRRLTVTAPTAADLPTPVDEEVFFGLVRLSRTADHFPCRTVSYTRYGLIQLLGWPASGQSYRRLDQSLARWLRVTFTYEEASDERHFREGFRILESSSEGSFTWAPAVFRSFQAEHWQSLDLALLLRLRQTLASRAYRILSRGFTGATRLDLDLREFACERLGLSRGHDAGKLKEKLRPALEELEQVNFLEPLAPSERYARVGGGRWRVLFLRPLPHRRSRATLRALERGLTERGVSAARATELVASHDPGRVGAKLQVFDWLRGTGQPQLFRDPAGYLTRSIIQDHQPVPEIEATNAAPRPRTRREGGSGGQPVRRAPVKKTEVEQTPIDRFWNSLSAPERERHTRDALEEADPWLLEQYQRSLDRPHLAQHFLQAILDRHIGRLLRAPADRA
jgi:hypothetical protein